MQDSNIYQDIASRSGGDIYIGVVGPVRTGKSTFIKKFMTELVLSGMEGGVAAQMIDELPQSAAGRTVMTTEPKFIPAKGAEIEVGNAKARVRLIDCVGFPVEGASGFEEDGAPRLVKTMWSDSPLPFAKAAELGTQKVICDHSTIGLVVTTDGSVTDIPREAYVPAEERTVRELKAIGKPFAVVLNCANPQSDGAVALRAALQQKYDCAVVAINCEKADRAQLEGVLRAVLFEFPVTGIDVVIPEWMRVLPAESEAIGELVDGVRKASQKVQVMRQCSAFDDMFAESQVWQSGGDVSLCPSTGRVTLTVGLKDGVFFKMLSQTAGEEIADECALMEYVSSASRAKRGYEKVKDALECARVTGYGIVKPDDDDLVLEQPKLVRQGSNVGIKLTATAPSYHVVKVDVCGEVSPIMGNAAQSEDMVAGIMKGFETDPQTTWNTSLFGKSLRSMVKEGLEGKVSAMQEETRGKMRRAITRIVNEGKGGVICILL